MSRITCTGRPRLSAEELDGASRLALKIRYDDGFVAYLNGTEVARKNFVGAPAWNSVAAAQNSDAAAVSFEEVNITPHVGRLQRGRNILAIHGLNISTSSSDFLISVELVASREPEGGVPADVSPPWLEPPGAP